jgi:hypothetical protein
MLKVFNVTCRLTIPTGESTARRERAAPISRFPSLWRDRPDGLLNHQSRGPIDYAYVPLLSNQAAELLDLPASRDS